MLAEQQQFTQGRTGKEQDELWVVSHPPVFTLGQSGKIEHVLNLGNIPLLQSDRGGQVTYHGPGQIVIYTLLNVKQRGLGGRALVSSLELAILDCLSEFGVQAELRPGAPGVYVGSQKIAALGLRISRGYSYHGLSLNVKMDLLPFSQINPCGYAGLEVTDMFCQGVEVPQDTIEQALLKHLQYRLTSAEIRAS